MSIPVARLDMPGSGTLLDVVTGRADFSTLDSATAAAWLASLRKPALGLGGYAVVMSTPHDELDRWGYKPDALSIMRAIQQRWDAKGTLYPGGFVIE